MPREYIYKNKKDIKFLFDNVASRYDLLNRIMTFGFDKSWRKKLTSRLDIVDNMRILDVGTGTGDIPLSLVFEKDNIMCIGLDFAQNMINMAQKDSNAYKVQWMSGDAVSLPFSELSFDIVTSSFLIRNILSPKKSLQEQYRVLEEGGRVFCLETSPPGYGFLGRFIKLYLLFLPLLGKLIASDERAYRYLVESTTQFLSADEMTDLMMLVGFKEVRSCQMMFGLVSLHWGIK